VEQAEKLDPVIGREEEIRRIVTFYLEGPVLIGEPGV